MSLNRYNPKRDGNETEIVEALEKVGAVVHRLSDKDVPDLLVGYDGKTYLLEVKNGDKAQLTKGQQNFFKKWIGGKAIVVRTPEQAVEAIGGEMPRNPLITEIPIPEWAR